MEALSEASRPAGDRVAAGLRGFGPLGIAAILAILAGNLAGPPLSAVLVLAWAWRSCTPSSELGFVRPASWARTAILAIVAGAAFKLAMKAVVMPLLGADPINRAYHYLAGNRAALPGMVLAVIFGAGFGEEVVYRGWMFERLAKLLGTSPPAKAFIVLLTSTLFGLAHWTGQGLPGVEQATIFGLVAGTIFAFTRRLWPLVIAHAAFDLTALAIVYWDIEPSIAQLLFK